MALPHARTLDAAPDRVGPLLDRVGSEHDPLWPTELKGSARLLWPVIRRFHDAYIEDMFDRAEAATTSAAAAERPCQPRWLRLWNAWEMRRDRWRVRPGTARWAGRLVPASLLAIAAIHGAWALGWRWPGGSDQAFADRVVGPGASLPSAELTWAVAALLAGTAVVSQDARNRQARRR